MKFNINVNQLAIVKSGIDVDIFDAIIIDYLIEFSKSDSIVKISEKNIEFYWFSYDKIINDLPLLNLKRDSVYRRMKRLSEIGLLIQFPESKKIGRSFFAITEKCKKLIFSENPNVGMKTETSDSNPTSRKNQQQTSDSNPDNYSINNNNSSLFSNENNDEAVAPKQKCPIYQDAVKIYFNFYRTKNGHNPKMDSADGKALKQLIAYFKTLAKDSPNQKDEVLKMFHLIFKNWQLVDPFHQKNIKLTQINSQINNIINSIKNGKSKSNSNNSGSNGNKIVGSSNPFTIDDFVADSNNRPERN